MPMIPRIIDASHSRMSVKRAISVRTVAKGAGAVVLGIIALDLVATIATLAIGATWLRR